MKSQTKILLFAVLIMFLNGSSFGQSGAGDSKTPVKPPKNFEHIGCGIRYPFPGRFTKSTSIGYSPYRELGGGMINRFETNIVTYDIGCIELDDPARKMKKDVLISILNSNTKAYLMDSSEYVSLPTITTDGREIYEFKSNTDYLRSIKYFLEGNRITIFLASAYDARGIERALKLFDSVEQFSVKETVEKRMEMATRKSLPQSPSVKLTQTDAAHNKLKGNVKWVRREVQDVPFLVGTGNRRIRSDETYDRSGNLLKSFWFQDSGYPTSVRIYGFVDGARVSDSERIRFDTVFSISVGGRGNIKLPPADPRYNYRYKYRYDDSKRLIERKVYNNRGILRRIHSFTYKVDLMEEKRLGTDGKLISTKRRQLDKNGNVIKYEFWWYDLKDREIETYDYKKFDRFGNWTERQVLKKIIDRGLIRIRTSNEFRMITYYGK